jgi:6-pyruvoyltetrahydropterin/6-carboxytetrahydropterin synthase
MNITLTKKYQFSAAHRLHSDFLNAEQNIELYEKCNNLNGHGHDYTLYVTVKGEPDPLSGMILPLAEFDAIIRKTLDKLDHKHLDKEVSEFVNEISTSENIIQFMWDSISKDLQGLELFHLKLWETNNNYFELGREE